MGKDGVKGLVIRKMSWIDFAELYLLQQNKYNKANNYI